MTDLGWGFRLAHELHVKLTLSNLNTNFKIKYFEKEFFFCQKQKYLRIQSSILNNINLIVIIL